MTMNNIPDPLSMIHQFNDDHRVKFNPELFRDSDEGIIEALEKVILSCQRDSFFTIKVEGFEVVEEYDKIMDILREHEANTNKNNGKDNIYDYINLKDTAMRLLIVHYYIAIKDESEHIQVLICVPRTVDKYYFRINGNTYSSMIQVVDASTYNSSTSSSKRDSITLKTLFQPLRIYRYQTSKKTDLLDIVSGQPVRCTYYTSYVFKKSLLAMKYILAKYGFYEAMTFLCLDYVNVYDHNPLEAGLDVMKDYYVFEKQGIYITVPRTLFDNVLELQSFIYTVMMCINKDTEYNTFFSREYWLIALASEFNNKTVEKGLSILDSLEFVLDIITKETLALPEDDKKDVYSVIRWMIGEFSNLMLKSNIDVSIKRIRKPEYMASLYAMKQSTSIYRISDIGKKAKLESIKKALNTSPMYLLNAISNCKLINYRNYVNDMDSLVALKYTFKGIAGIGEKNNSLPNIYRAINKYQLGITDPDASSPGDPGASGTFCPTAKIYENGMLSEYQEPNSWRSTIKGIFDTYRRAVGMKECLIAMQSLLDGETSDKVAEIDQTIQQIDSVVKPLINNAFEDNMNPPEDSSVAASIGFTGNRHKGFYLDESALLVYEQWEGEEYGF